MAGSVSLGGGTPGLPAEESAPAEFLRKWETLVDMEAAEMEVSPRQGPTLLPPHALTVPLFFCINLLRDWQGACGGGWH